MSFITEQSELISGCGRRFERPVTSGFLGMDKFKTKCCAAGACALQDTASHWIAFSFLCDVRLRSFLLTQTWSRSLYISLYKHHFSRWLGLRNVLTLQTFSFWFLAQLVLVIELGYWILSLGIVFLCSWVRLHVPRLGCK